VSIVPRDWLTGLSALNQSRFAGKTLYSVLSNILIQPIV